jgi:DNA primase
VLSGEEGRRYDRFRDRIMFPIHNQRGAIIGFGGRVIDQGEPKYLNSPETPLFEKGRELYGLFQARGAIRDAQRVLVVEGYMDVVALSQYGVSYAVATLGTATTPWQIQKLFRQTDNVIYCFDGDAAGRRAAWRALENTLSQLQDGKRVRFLFLPAEHDPDSFVRANGKETFETLLEAAPSLSEILVRELVISRSNLCRAFTSQNGATRSSLHWFVRWRRCWLSGPRWLHLPMQNSLTRMPTSPPASFHSLISTCLANCSTRAPMKPI